MEKNLRLVYAVSLGCSKNFVDMEVMAAALVTHGYGIAVEPTEADAYLVNTCAFIPPARQEAEQHIAAAIKWKKAANARRKVVVSGCLCQWDKDGSYRRKFPMVDAWLGVDQPLELSACLDRLFVGEAPAPAPSRPPEYLYDHNTPRLQLTPPHYAYLKIADGCDNHCAYCSIPAIRGKLRCRTQESVVTEARNLLNNGAKELIVIAQDSTAFGKGTRDTLASLLRALDALEGGFWIRLHYAHPARFTDELIETFALGRHLLPYIDMPLQHISDKLLKAMNRNVTQDEILKLLEKLRRNVPGVCLRSTFLAGFPGETEADFKELLAFAHEFKFERLGAFAFYPEPNTKAATLRGQVPAATADARQKALIKIHEENSLALNKRLEGSEFDVIIDSAHGKDFAGRTYMDSPDIDNVTRVKSKQKLRPGDVVRARITSATAYESRAELV